jgi:hypothetical protein
MQVYRMQDYNDGKPFARAIMDDGRAELLSGDNPEGTSFTSVRVLEETDVKKAQYGWRSRRGDMETRIKNSERERILQEATKSNNR